ncbi:MAG: nucleotidyltransferase substrate binding protein [Bacteroidales bacterium]|nr:nucleotidyltransferase substrate binding protein [Bacteroidales bacterium]
MDYKQTRWKQRFANFELAYSRLKEAVEEIDHLNRLSKEGLIQRFEYTLELAWKTLKDYLESRQEIAKFPKDVIKKSFRAELIDNGEIWMEMLEKRNLLSHTYEEETFKRILSDIVDLYFDQITKLYLFLKNEE